MKTTVVHCKKSAYDVYIGRGSIWGNRWTHLKGKTRAEFVVATREEAIAEYAKWVVTQPHLMAQLHKLRGKVLGCWCRPLSCHGNILAALADKLPDETA